ncbi:potassium channel family protein [Catalinimonas alkaloidigena]|nr:potassium channel family protein [Catalinimonas alkaloidigena]
MSETGSVVSSTQHTAASMLEKVYFSGYVLSTMGNGDFKPGSKAWELLIAAFSFIGFVFITTAMTYLVSVSSAIIHKRSLSLFISNLGETPQDLLLRTGDKEHVEGLLSVATALQNMINRHTQNHTSYPIAHYFHSGRKQDAIALQMTKLDEALTLLEYIVEADVKALLPLRHAINNYLDVLGQKFIQPQAETHIIPQMHELESAGWITMDERALAKKWALAASRRAMLAALLYDDGWNWTDVYPES